MNDICIPTDSVRTLIKLINPVYTGYNLLRLGNEGDGGYLLPDCLSGIECCLSPGTGCDPATELVLAKQYNIKCLLCDPGTPDPQINDYHQNISYNQISLGSKSTDKEITLADWLAAYKLQDACPLALLMDIEGGEYSVLNGITDIELSRFRTMSIEFHAFAHFLSESSNLSYLISLFTRLSRFFDIVHLAPK